MGVQTVVTWTLRCFKDLRQRRRDLKLHITNPSTCAFLDSGRGDVPVAERCLDSEDHGGHQNHEADDVYESHAGADSS